MTRRVARPTARTAPSSIPRSRSTSTCGATRSRPTQVRLHRADGTEVRVIDANPVESLSQYRLSKPEFVEVKARDGFVMDAMLIKPPDFDPSRRYPVYQLTYAGPDAAPTCATSGAGRPTCITSCSRSTASSSGCSTTAAPAARAPRRSGRSTASSARWSCSDLEDGITWLKQQPYVDASRIAAPRLELRRVHDRVRADPQHQLGGRHRRRAGDRLAQLRHGLHRALHEDAAATTRTATARRRRGLRPPSCTGRCC